MALESRIRIRLLNGPDIALGPGKADLLDAIAQTGSISAAAKRLGMSYRRAWLLVETMNRSFDTPLVGTAKGGSHGGGAQVTDAGRTVLDAFRAMQHDVEAAAETHRRRIEAFAARRPRAR